jgi:hypothetical protein
MYVLFCESEPCPRQLFFPTYEEAFEAGTKVIAGGEKALLYKLEELPIGKQPVSGVNDYERFLVPEDRENFVCDCRNYFYVFYN